MLRFALMLAVAFTLAPIVAAAQTGKVWRIGYLLLPPLAEKQSPERQAFLQGLRELGYNEGSNIVIEYRSAAWNRELLADLAAELVDRKVDVILAAGPQAALAAREATKTVPIVVIAEVDLVEIGLVATLSRHGSNVTGFSGTFPELAGKRLELLREAVPRLSSVTVMWNPSNPATASEWKMTQAAARTLGITLASVEVRGAEDFTAALSKMSQRPPSAVVMISDTVTTIYRQILADFAVKNRIPTIMASRSFPELGGLMSYGPTIADLFRRAATQVDKVLRGAKPGDLPVERPTKFDLVINVKTAKALGLTIPQTLLLRADEIIQ
jgi:putative ABC transport system substrate-binding protein